MFLSSICLNRPQSFGIGALAVSVFVLFFEGSGMPCPPRGYPPGGYPPGGYCPGGYCPGGYCPGGYCPGGYCPPYCAAAVPSPSTNTKTSPTPLNQRARQTRCAKFRYTFPCPQIVPGPGWLHGFPNQWGRPPGRRGSPWT